MRKKSIFKTIIMTTLLAGMLSVIIMPNYMTMPPIGSGGPIITK